MVKNLYSSETWGPYTYNACTVTLHALQFVIVVFVIGFMTSRIDPNFVFISPRRELIWQNYALIKSDTVEPTCPDMNTSSVFNDRDHWVINKDMVNHDIFNFENTVLIPFQKRGAFIDLDTMIAIFFLLSAAFQFWNGYVLHRTPDFPRIINYLEYSVSSSLMIIVMAVHMGIAELYTITSLAGLFFGMNMFGACTEVILDWYHMVYTATNLKASDNKTPFSTEQTQSIEGNIIYKNIFLWAALPQFAAWILFLFAMVPVLVQYRIIQECSNTGVPTHVHFAVAVQAFLFCIFGLTQSFSVYYRLTSPQHRDGAIRYMDKINVLLSFAAKTILAWSLLAPALAVKPGALRQ